MTVAIFGHWCHTCSGKNITIEDLQDIALERGGWCLSPDYFGINIKLWWQCREGHVWDATPNMVKNDNNWCPKCEYIKRKKHYRYKKFPHKHKF